MSTSLSFCLAAIMSMLLTFSARGDISPAPTTFINTSPPISSSLAPSPANDFSTKSGSPTDANPPIMLPEGGKPYPVPPFSDMSKSTQMKDKTGLNKRAYSMKSGSMSGSYGSYSRSGSYGSYSRSGSYGSYSRSGSYGSYSRSGSYGSYSRSGSYGSYSGSMWSGSYKPEPNRTTAPSIAPTLLPTMKPLPTNKPVPNPTMPPKVPTAKPTLVPTMAKKPTQAPQAPPPKPSVASLKPSTTPTIAPSPTFDNIPNIPIRFQVTQIFSDTTTSQAGFSKMIQDVVAQIASIPSSDVSLVTVQGTTTSANTRALTTSTVKYSITVQPSEVKVQTPQAAYAQVSQAMLQSVQSGSPNQFTVLMVEASKSIKNSGVSSSSSAVTGGMIISQYNALYPTQTPTAGANANAAGSASTSTKEDETIGIIIGAIFAVLLVGGLLFWYQRQSKNTDEIPARDVSMAKMDPSFRRQTHDFDSEVTVSPLPAAGKTNIIDIIPAQNRIGAHPLADKPRRL